MLFLWFLVKLRVYRRVGRFRFDIKTVTVYLRRGKKKFPSMNKSSCHPTDINGRKYILIIFFQNCYNRCFCTSFLENIICLVSQTVCNICSKHQQMSREIWYIVKINILMLKRKFMLIMKLIAVNSGLNETIWC